MEELSGNEYMPELIVPTNRVVCDPEIRRQKCDSLYIRLNTQLKKKMVEAVQIIDKDTNDSAEDLKTALKEKLDVRFEDEKI